MSRLILLLSLILIVNYVLSSTPGHLQSFGQAGRYVNIEEFQNDYPDLQRLVKYYIPKSEGFVVRQVLNRDLHFNIWKTDDQLENEVEHLGRTNVYVESLEQNQRLQMKFVDFIDRYQRERLVLVDHLPEILRKYLVIPRPLQCDVFLLALQSIFMVMNDVHSSPLILNDGNDLLMCLYRGNKQLVLVNTNQYPDVRQYVAPGKRQPRKSINPERVDLNQFPSLANIDYYHVKLTAGDCILIPEGWVFQERSIESSIAILYNIEHRQVSTVNLNAIETCSEYDSTLTFDQVDLANGNNEPTSLRDVMINLINSNTNSFEKWQETFSKHLSFDLNSNPDTSAIFDEFYGIIDVNGDGEITMSEVEQINGAHQHHISDILYEMVKVVGDKQSSSKSEQDENTKTEL